MKKIIKSIIFLLIFLILFYYTFKILWPTKNAISYFYDEPKNSLDVVYIGSSNAYAHFNTTLAYNLYGYTTGMLSTDNEPFPLIKYLIEDSERYQKPKVYVIDLFKCQENIEDISNEFIRNTTDSMKFSKNRINAINKLLSYKNVNKNEYINYYFSFFMYHNLWKHINVSFFKGNTELYKGYLFREGTTKNVSQTPYKWEKYKMKLQEENKNILTELVKYIKDRNLNVIFVIPNRCYNETEMKKINYATEMLKQEKFNIINFNTIDNLQIDFNNDFYNEGHLNVYGATKYTLYFSKYLKENYDLPDHRNDKNYDSWKAEYERFKVDFNKLTSKDFNSLL